MNPIEFEGCNMNLTKPEGWTDEQCYSLPAMFQHDPNTGMPFYTVAFMPSKEDIEAINAGRPIFLQQTGARFQPIAIFTTDETGNCNDAG